MSGFEGEKNKADRAQKRRKGTTGGKVKKPEKRRTAQAL